MALVARSVISPYPMTRIAVLGNGFLGNRFAAQISGAELVRVDITDVTALKRALTEGKYDVVVNAAGKTGRPNVDWCESHREETYRSNVTGALNVADVCASTGAYLLHLGSGCVFYGDSPSPAGWREDDHANPSAFYSRAKYAADLVLSELPNVAVARLRMPIDSLPGDRNLITKLSRYSQVVDVENSVTIVDDLVDVSRKLIEKRAVGVFHVTNPGTMRHRDLLALYKELVDPTHDYTLIAPEDLVTKGLAVKGRSNGILSSQRLVAAGITMRPVDVALRETMQEYARAVRSVAR